MNAEKATRRMRAMRLQPREVHTVVEFLAEWNPYALDAALDHVSQQRREQGIRQEKGKRARPGVDTGTASA